MQTLPNSVRHLLPLSLQKFRTSTRSWLCQLYYRDPYLHYEAWNLGRQRGLMEIGLHFESKNRATNARCLAGFQQHMFEVKAALGSDWEAEPWDKGWTKVYTVIELDGFNEAYLEQVARLLALSMTVLQPIFDEI